MINAAPSRRRPAALHPMWLGWEHHDEAAALFRRARRAGLSAMRAHAVGVLATFKDCWATRRTIARIVGCSVRTVGRGFRDAKEEGFLVIWTAEKGAIPPGKKHPVAFRWSHRRVVGWGTHRPAERKREIEEARAKWLRNHTAAELSPKTPKVGSTVDPTPSNSDASKPRRTRRQWSTARRLTAEQIDAELAQLVNERPPDKPPDS